MPTATATTSTALSATEREVLDCLCGGLSTREMMAELEVTEDSIRGHLACIYRKLGTLDRAHTIAHAFRTGLVAHPDAPIVQATVYTVSHLPEDHPHARLYAITVAYCGREKWIARNQGRALDADGAWDPMPDTVYDGAWVAAHQHPFAEALRLAKDAAPQVRVGDVPALAVRGADR